MGPRPPGCRHSVWVQLMLQLLPVVASCESLHAIHLCRKHDAGHFAAVELNIICPAAGQCLLEPLRPFLADGLIWPRQRRNPTRLRQASCAVPSELCKLGLQLLDLAVGGGRGRGGHVRRSSASCHWRRGCAGRGCAGSRRSPQQRGRDLAENTSCDEGCDRQGCAGPIFHLNPYNRGLVELIIGVIMLALRFPVAVRRDRGVAVLVRALKQRRVGWARTHISNAFLCGCRERSDRVVDPQQHLSTHPPTRLSMDWSGSQRSPPRKRRLVLVLVLRT